jgi:hypothetical protein
MEMIDQNLSTKEKARMRNKKALDRCARQSSLTTTTNVKRKKNSNNGILNEHTLTDVVLTRQLHRVSHNETTLRATAVGHLQLQWIDDHRLRNIGVRQ